MSLNAAPILLLVIALTLAPAWRTPARAAEASDDKRACAASSEEAQLRRIQGKLRGAREELLVCSRAVCPPLVKHDCEQWLTEVGASLPTIVVSAKDRLGRDAGDVQVRVDGEPFLDKLDGTAAAIDPGAHLVRFEHGSDPAVEQRIIVREGEKNRIVSVQFGPPRVAAPARMPRAPATEARSPALPVVAYSLIGAGVVALGFATYFEIDQLNGYSALKNGCSLKDACTQSQVDAIANQRVYAGVLLGAGLASVGVGIILLVTRSSHDGGHAPPAAPPLPGVSFGLSPTPSGGAASLRLRF